MEKKQRKFDAEIGSLNEEVRREAEGRDKVTRELEEAKRSKFMLEDEIQVSDGSNQKSKAIRGEIRRI